MSMYGTRDAAQHWEHTYTEVMLSAGFNAGLASPCVFFHPGKDLRVVIHGDDFTVLGDDDSLLVSAAYSRKV